MKRERSVERVTVLLNEGLTILDLKANNNATLAAFRQILKNNGFVAKESTVVARGVVADDGKTFVVGGTGERLALSSPAKRSGDNWTLAVRAPERP